MGLFDKIFGKKRDPNIVTKEIVDPAKAGVANQFSAFLQDRVGKGLPAFDSSVALPSGLENRVSEFLALDSGEFFQEKVAAPATKRFKEDFLPELKESFAGGLRGSGRFRSEAEQIGAFGERLAGAEAELALNLPKAQLEVGSGFFALKDLQMQRKLQDFLRSLPEFNPVLGQALQFLSEGTSSGKTILSGLDPGKATSGFGDFLTLLTQAGATVAAGALGGKK